MSEKTATERMQSKHQKEERKVHTYYIIKDEKISRRLKKCPRCSAFMAFHKTGQQRWACGGCGYTQFVSASSRAN